jgi:hypothetical protein
VVEVDEGCTLLGEEAGAAVDEIDVVEVLVEETDVGLACRWSTTFA